MWNLVTFIFYSLSLSTFVWVFLVCLRSGFSKYKYIRICHWIPSVSFSNKRLFSAPWAPTGGVLGLRSLFRKIFVWEPHTWSWSPDNCVVEKAVVASRDRALRENSNFFFPSPFPLTRKTWKPDRYYEAVPIAHLGLPKVFWAAQISLTISSLFLKSESSKTLFDGRD